MMNPSHLSAFLVRGGRFGFGIVLGFAIPVLIGLLGYGLDSMITLVSAHWLGLSDPWHTISDIRTFQILILGSATMSAPLAAIPFPGFTKPLGRRDSSSLKRRAKLINLGQQYPVERNGYATGLLVGAVGSAVAMQYVL